ncbi:rhodanese-like domain-containing protein [Kaarinaea lacus]
MMRQILSLLAILSLSSFASVPVLAENWEVPVVLDGATPITAEELVDLIDQMDNLVLIDTRQVSRFKEGTIQGSKSLPNTKTSPGTLSNLAPDKLTPLVFYCDGLSCPHSMKSVKKAVSYGYVNIFWFRGGIDEWTEKGLPIKEK